MTAFVDIIIVGHVYFGSDRGCGSECVCRCSIPVHTQVGRETGVAGGRLSGKVKLSTPPYACHELSKTRVFWCWFYPAHGIFEKSSAKR